MKKLLAAAVAATMSATAMADISITGDAEFNYDNDTTSGNGAKTSTNTSDFEVNLNVVGKAGDTTVVADFELGTNGNQSGGDSGVAVENLYMTTKLGPVSAKVGNYTTGTTALLGEIDNGGRSHGKMKFSYTTNGIEFYAGNNGDDSTNNGVINGNAYAGVIATVEGWKLQLKKNGASNAGTGNAANDNIAYGVQGVAGPVGIRVEYKDDNRDNSDVIFANFTGKFDNISLGLAYLEAESDSRITEDDSSIFQVENGLNTDGASAYTAADDYYNSDSNIQLSASIAVDGTTYGAYIGQIGSDTANQKDRDYYKVSAKRALASGVTAAASYTTRETGVNADTKKKNFSVDLTVAF